MGKVDLGEVDLNKPWHVINSDTRIASFKTFWRAKRVAATLEQLRYELGRFQLPYRYFVEYRPNKDEDNYTDYDPWNDEDLVKEFSVYQ